MKLSGFKIGLFILFMAILFSSLSYESKAQTPFTNTGKAKFIKTTVDTFSIPGVSGVYRMGFITNQSSTLSMNVMFSKRDGSKDTSSRVVIPAGKTLHFNFVGTKIFRYAVTGTDSVYSQVIIGDVKLNYLQEDLEDLLNSRLAYQSESVFAFYEADYVLVKNAGRTSELRYVKNKGWKLEQICASAAVICNKKRQLGQSDYFWGS